jgi:hypothetical protein
VTLHVLDEFLLAKAWTWLFGHVLILSGFVATEAAAAKARP